MEREWSDCVGHTRGYYNPTVVPKRIGEYNPAAHDRDIWLLYAGDFSSEVAYKPHLIRMLLTYPPHTNNLLANGDFESGGDGWWVSPTATIAVDRPHRGSQSARVSMNDGFLQGISGLTPGDMYQVSGYLQ